MNLSDIGVFINGAYGVGKSAVLEHLGDRFAAEGLPFSLFDVDWFHRSWPPAESDPRNVLTEAENMRAVWANYRLVGPRTPIVAGVIASAEDRERYESVFGRRLHVMLLTASPSIVEERLRGRYDEARGSALDWHLARHERLAADLSSGGRNDLVVDTDARTPAEVASAVFERVFPHGAGR